jgi:pimeloyl-ACP methyl ester carboxylesterase
MKNLRKWLPRILLVLVLLLIVGMIGFAVWGINGLAPDDTAKAALTNQGGVTVTESNDLYTFLPSGPSPTVGFIFYPGGRVLPGAYAPYMRDFAKQGYAAFIVKMPLNFAIFGISRADDVIKANPQIKTWVIGGHSLGGSMAAQYVAGTDKISGIVFWGSYTPADLSKKKLAVLSVFGGNDGVLNQKAAADAQKLLPPDAQSVTIEGSNHAFFGYYGPQDGDKPATITHEAAATQIEAATLAFLQKVSGAQGS